jgi:DNA-binding PadR family transcriptional regulator
VLQGLALRRAILDALRAKKSDTPEASLVRQEDLAKGLQTDADRLEAHFTFLERAHYITSLRMPGPDGAPMRFFTITPDGERYLKNEKNFQPPKGEESPFKVVHKGEEPLVTDLGALRKMIQDTEWVLDEEKPEILAKMDELGQLLSSDRFDPAAVSGLKLYFERYKWLTPHVQAILKRQYGF